MTKKIVFSALTILTLLFVGCSNDTLITPNNEINDFVWKGMNSWYNWQEDVPDLADTKDDNSSAYASYLNGFDNPENLFSSLLFDHPNTDRFSWFIEDYEVQQQQFQGITKSFGFRLQAVLINDNDDIIFYVRYVAPNSPASNAGIARGDIFNAINGVVLNNSNYDAAVSGLNNDTVTLSFVTEDGGILTPVGDKTITAIQLSENPVHFKKVFNDINGKKVGYLVYNAFRSSYNDELNEAMAFFLNEGINELVLDLRLNGGGSVQTMGYLSSMIYANGGTDKVAELKWNSKHSDQNSSYNLENTMNVYDSNGTKTGEEPINRLNQITRLYALTSGSTASASEAIINGLRAYIPVKVIGTTTYGKNVGSITLYDSPNSDFTDESTANVNHKNAMQPITFQIYDKFGVSDYTNGFDPDIEVKEWNFWNSILPFGDENEVVLKAALDDIIGISLKSTPTSKYEFAEVLDISTLENKFEKEMYLENEFFK